MLRKLIHIIAYRHHPWREMQFDELAEIYTSMSLRSLGFGMIGIFVPVFLHTKGVELRSIFWFLSVFFFLRIPTSFFAGYLTGRIGPKHTLAISTVVVVLFLAMLLSFESLQWPLELLACVLNIANSLFFVAYQADFAKVKHHMHGGKELGWLTIFERVGGALGPVVGGVLGSLVAPEATLYTAIIILIVSLIPLFRTKEPLHLNTRVRFSGFRPQDHMQNFLAIAAFNVQHVAISWIWPLFIAVFIFTEGTYVKVGALVGLTMGISILCARAFGVFIDSRKGRYVLKYGVLLNFVLNAVKATVSGSSGVVAASALGEPIALSYSMPLTKGLYDESDGSDNHRIVYLTWAEVAAGSAKALFCFGLFIALRFFDAETAIRVGFIIVPFIGLLMMHQKFSALR